VKITLDNGKKETLYLSILKDFPKKKNLKMTKPRKFNMKINGSETSRYFDNLPIHLTTVDGCAIINK